MASLQQNDAFRDECGVVGIYGNDQAGHLAYLGLHSLQHRGQDSAGIATSNGKGFFREVGLGLVADVFCSDKLSNLKGDIAVGHVRYTTQGTGLLSDAQPIRAQTKNGQLALAHNGNLTNASFLRQKLENEGAIFQGASDTEVICHLFARAMGEQQWQCVLDAVEKLQGAFSLCMMVDNSLIGIRDLFGVRPLMLGKLDKGYVISSEDCSFSLLDAQFIREIDPGEMVVINESGVKSYRLVGHVPKNPAPCIFEHVYFARPDSRIFGRSVYATRKALGQELAKESPVDADVVIAVPDSGVLSAMGYSEVTNIPYDIGLVRNHYVGRTFIEPESRIRHFGVRLKLSPVKEVVENRRLVVVDDSIVRGTTSKKIVSLLRAAGAKEIHMRVSAPMTTNPCHYGIATPTKEELIASQKSLSQISSYLEVDSLAYLSLEGLHRSFEPQHARRSVCDACFSGDYPIALPSLDAVITKAHQDPFSKNA